MSSFDAARPAAPARPSRGRAGLLVLLATALLGLLFLVPSTAPATTVGITEGSVHWGFKQSWRSYIGEPGITVSDGVTRAADGGFDWPVVSGSYDDATHALELRLGGSVHFTAHDGLLDATLKNGRVVISAEATEIRFDIRSKNMDGVWVDLTDAPLAVLGAEEVTPDVTGGTTTWNAVPTAITQHGTDAFTYVAGTALDPLTISYSGPGGKPDFAEQWTPAGTHRYTDTPVRDLLPGVSWPAWIREGFIDEEAGILHAIGYPQGGTTDHLLAIDLSSGQIVAQSDPLVGQRYAFDPVHHTVFVGLTGVVTGYTWNATTREYESEQIFAAAPGGVITYDVATETLAVADANTGVRLATRTAGGGFTTRTVTTTSVRYLNSFLLDGHGRALFTVSLGTDRVLQLNLDEETPTAHPVVGLGGAAYQQLVLGATGEAWTSGTIAGVPQLQRLVRGQNGDYAASGPAARAANAITALRRSPDGSRIYGLAPYYNTIQVFEDGALRSVIDTDGPASSTENKLIVLPRADGSVLAAHPHRSLARPNDTIVSWPLHRFDLSAVSPTVTAHPEPATVTLASGVTSTAVELSAAASGTPAPTVRWQARSGGVGRFSDVPGATNAQLNVDAHRGDDGTEYRAVFTNDAGSIATEPTTLTVRSAPEISQQPVSVTVAAGDDAVLKVMPTGSPHPTVTWQTRSGGFWRSLDPEDGDVELSGEGHGFLTIKRTTVEQSGAVFRAKVTNAVGSVYSAAVTLTVRAPTTTPVTFGSGHVDWGFANRWRCYVVGTVARGGIDLAGGVTRVPGTTATGSLCPAAGEGSEALRFPVRGGSYDPVSRQLEVQLGGSVRFWGHAHGDTAQLDTTFSNLRIVVTGATGTLYADTVGTTMDDPVVVSRSGVALAVLDLTDVGATPTDSGISWSDVPSALAGPGAAVFGSYPVGEPFDAVSMALTFGTPQTDPEPPLLPEPLPQPVPLPAPVPETPVVPVTPVVPSATPRKAPKLAPAAKLQTLSASRTVRIATLTCSAGGSCRVTVPRTVTVRIGGVRYRATVIAPKTLAAGKRATVRLRLSTAAAKRLTGRRASVRLKVRVAAGTKTTSRTVGVTVKGRTAARSR